MGLCIRCFTGEDEPSDTSECGSALAATATDDVESCRAPDRHRRHLGLSQYSVNVVLTNTILLSRPPPFTRCREQLVS